MSVKQDRSILDEKFVEKKICTFSEEIKPD